MPKKSDYDLIFLCSENSRAKIKDLSSILRKSSQRLKYSTKLLEKQNIITMPHCIFDYSYFGQIMFRVYFKGGYIGERDKTRIIEELSTNPFVVSVYELTGEYDLTIEMLSPNPSRFNKELKKIILKFPTLNNHKIVLNYVSYIYPHSHLLKNNDLINLTSTQILIGGDRAQKEFTEAELRIMENLLKNPKIRLTSLAKRSDLNIKTVNKILSNLINQRVIRAFKYVINNNSLDLQKHRLFLKLHNQTPEREQELKKFFLKTKEIVRVNKTVGDWNLEIDMESQNKTKIRYLILKLREDFKELIENFNIMEFYEYYKKSYLPTHFFDLELDLIQD